MSHISRLNRLETQLGSYCSQCPHCNPLAEEAQKQLDAELRALITDLEERARCDVPGCDRGIREPDATR